LLLLFLGATDFESIVDPNHSHGVASDDFHDDTEEYSTTEDELLPEDETAKEEEKKKKKAAVQRIYQYTNAVNSSYPDQVKVQQRLQRHQTVRTKSVRARYTLPTTVVLVPYGHHQSEAVRRGQATMDYQRSPVIHPVRKEMYLVAYDLSPETHALFYRREYNQSIDKLPTTPECLYSDVMPSLVQHVMFDAETNVAYFPSGTLNKLFRYHLFPRSGKSLYNLR
jgi:hypothetical protein